MGKIRFRRSLQAALTVSGLLLSAPAASLAASQPQAIALPAMPLDRAVTELAGQTGLTVGGDGSLLRGKTSPPLEGTYSPIEALRLLLQGSGVIFTIVDDNTVALERVGAAPENGASQLGPITV